MSKKTTANTTRRTLLKAAVLGAGAAAVPGAVTAAYAGDIGTTAAHPGMLHTQADFDRMKAQVAAGVQPVTAGWNRLTANSHSQSSWVANPQETIIRGGDGQNYGILYNDIHAAYQNALRWKVGGNAAHANTARDILNAWSARLKTVTGNADRFLAAGIYGYQFANAAEIMRGYSGFDLGRFQSMMQSVFYPLIDSFLVNHNGACITNYWANWDLCNMNALLAIGILRDDSAQINRAVEYFKTGAGNGSILHAVPFLHSGGLAQWQESGRDQGHTMMGMGQMSTFCEMAWNQGIDLYGYSSNRFAQAAEYVARYNLGNTVPWTNYTWGTGQNCAQQTHTAVSAASRGQVRPVWAMIHNHYVYRRGMNLPYVTQIMNGVRPEGGGGDYGSTSGGFDQLGFGTLAYTQALGGGGLAAGVRSLQSVNYPDRYIRHYDWLGRIDPVTSTSDATTKADATFTVVAGLAGSGVSLRGTGGRYLRHRDFRLRLDADDGTAGFDQDATFQVKAGSASGTVTLESHNYNGYYVRHRDYELWLDPNNGAGTFRADSSFRATTPWA